MADHLAVVVGVETFDDPAALAADPAAAHMEYLHRHLQVVGVDGDDVGVGAVTEHDGLLLHRPAQGVDVVAQPGRPLEIEILGSRGHIPFELMDQLVGAAGQEVAEVTDDASVLVGRDTVDARCRTFIDVAEKARPVHLPMPFEHPVGAGPRRKHAGQQIDGLADRPGVRIRAEVAHTALARAAIDGEPRILLVQGDGQHGIGFVVAVADIETWIELLDPVVFELQRLDLGTDDRPLHRRRRRDHLPRPRMQRGDVGEIRGQPRP